MQCKRGVCLYSLQLMYIQCKQSELYWTSIAFSTNSDSGSGFTACVFQIITEGYDLPVMTYLWPSNSLWFLGLTVPLCFSYIIHTDYWLKYTTIDVQGSHHHFSTLMLVKHSFTFCFCFTHFFTSTTIALSCVWVSVLCILSLLYLH